MNAPARMDIEVAGNEVVYTQIFASTEDRVTSR